MHQEIISDVPHRRRNPLTDEWILVSPHRTRRPWMGQVETARPEKRPSHDPSCYLCPGNRRANGEINPVYRDTFVFTNDFSALLPGVPAEQAAVPGSLFENRTVTGECRVICFSPRHDLTLAEMDETGIALVVGVWQDTIRELGKTYPWVQIFENKGAVMGCSNPHPHGQVWAGSTLPNEAVKEDVNQRAFLIARKKVLLLEYAEQESALRQRLVVEGENWMALVPFWAIWPFETLVLPKRHVLRLTDLGKNEVEDLACVMKKLLTRYDNLFQASFPYTMGWHGAPTDRENRDHWQLHAHFYPPLLRSAEVKKFMVGYEMLAGDQAEVLWNRRPGPVK
jgi:UDPglucose--hexose-1-phosphate uridylyltransferase